MWAKRRGWELSSRVDREGQAESSLQCPCPSWERRLLCALSERLVLSGDGRVCSWEGASGVPLCAPSKVMWEPSTKTTATKKPSFCFPGASLQNTFNYSRGGIGVASPNVGSEKGRWGKPTLICPGKALSILEPEAVYSGRFLFWAEFILGEEGCAQRLLLTRARVLRGAPSTHLDGFSKHLFKGL